MNERPQNDKNANHMLWGPPYHGILFGSAAHNGSMYMLSVDAHSAHKPKTKKKQQFCL